MAAVIVEDPAWHAHARDALGRFIDGPLTRAIADDMRRDCPEKTGELLRSIRQLGNQIWVGSEVAFYWSYVEYGTRPHIIRSHGDYPLRNRETGEVFGRVVRHPGTQAQPFIRPNFYRYRSAL